jgi:hypothetical protein
MSALLAVATTLYPNGVTPTVPVSGPTAPVIGGSGGGSSGFIPVTQGGTDVVGFIVVLAAAVLVLGLLGVFVVLVVANRADPDPTGRRPRVVYHFFVSFITVLTAVAGSVLAVWSLFGLVGSHATPLGDDIARAVVLGGLVTGASLMVLVTHLQRGVELARIGTDPSDPSRRVGQSYMSAVSVVFILIELTTAVLSLYLVFAVIAPGVFGSFGGRSDALRDLLDAVYLSLLAATVLRTHRNLLPPGLWSHDGSTEPGMGGASAGSMPTA